MTKERLELLSDDVIKNLANKVGVRFNSDCSRDSLVSSIIDVMDEDRIEKESLLNLAVSIESKKYSVTIDEELDLAYDVDESMNLPERYNDNMLHFVLRDNSWGFILWDVMDSTIQKYKKKFTSISPVLRVIELDNKTYSKDAIIDIFDIEVEFGEKRRYVNLPHEETFYCVELIIVSETNESIICRSEIVNASRNHVNYLADGKDNLKKIIELSGFSTTDAVVKHSRGLNRILPIDTMEDDV